MWSDNETNSDLIDYEHLIQGVVEIINNEDLLPCSIGIFGDWGSGKSSLMQMIADRYKNEKDTLIVRFNGWLFEGYDDAKTVLMAKIVDEIIAKRTFSVKASKIAAKLLKRIDLIKIGGSLVKYGIGLAALGPAGLATLSATDIIGSLKESDYEKLIKEKQEGKEENSSRTNIQEFQKTFEELIDETNIKKIIVFIDDLDRCSTDTVIGTLEAIKLFLFTKHTAFIIGADERLIRYAVKRRFPEIPGDSTEVARDYLEKLIQYPVRIPALNTTELINYVNLLFAKLYVDKGEFEFVRENIMKAKKENGFEFLFGGDNAANYLNEVTEEQKYAWLLSAQIVPVLSVGLNGNPRQCKRFLNTLLLRTKMAESKNISLDKRILAKIMLLEYFKSETFKAFNEMQAQNNGLISNIEQLENMARDQPLAVADSGALTATTLSPEQEAYLADSWLKKWFQSEPPLYGLNLQPYFYFSRDKLSVIGVNLQRMTPAAQDVFRKILSDAQAVMMIGIRESKNLSQGDASAIFEAIVEKVKGEQNHDDDKAAFRKLYELTKLRPELLSQWISFIERMPIKVLPIRIITWITETTKDTEFSKAGKDLLIKWSKSGENTSLARIADKKLKSI